MLRYACQGLATCIAAMLTTASWLVDQPLATLKCDAHYHKVNIHLEYWKLAEFNTCNPLEMFVCKQSACKGQAFRFLGWNSTRFCFYADVRGSPSLGEARMDQLPPGTSPRQALFCPQSLKACQLTLTISATGSRFASKPCSTLKKAGQV